MPRGPSDPFGQPRRLPPLELSAWRDGECIGCRVRIRTRHELPVCADCRVPVAAAPASDPFGQPRRLPPLELSAWRDGECIGCRVRIRTRHELPVCADCRVDGWRRC